MKWGKLKEFCNSLDEKQLEKKVIFWREEEAISDIQPSILEEDHYVGENEEACYPLSDAGLDMSDIERKGLKKEYDKNDPILFEQF